MGYVYRYIDTEDNLVKYIGIVWSENRTLQQRIKEHFVYDEWCGGKRWKIEYLEIDNKTDCEGLEAHFISLYGTNKWHNKGKANWGVSNVYSKIHWDWKEFEYTSENDVPQKRNTRRISDSFLAALYNKSIYIFNNGVCYCFVRTFKKEPTYVFMTSSTEEESFAIKNNIRYMNREQLKSIKEMIEEDNKPFGYGWFPDEREQIKMEGNLKIEQCFTYKEKQRLLADALANKMNSNSAHIKRARDFIVSSVHEMTFDVDVMRRQKQLQCAIR